MRRSPERFNSFSTAVPYTIVHRWCIAKPTVCDVKMSWDGEPWLDIQDLQAFDSGKLVTVEPIRAESMFDGSANGARLSDHDGFLVTYRLAWRPRERRFAPALADPIGSKCFEEDGGNDNIAITVRRRRNPPLVAPLYRQNSYVIQRYPPRQLPVPSSPAKAGMEWFSGMQPR